MLCRAMSISSPKRISKLTGNTFDFGATISSFTLYVANEFIIGKAYTEISLENFGVGLSIASSGAGPFWHITKRNVPYLMIKLVKYWYTRLFAQIYLLLMSPLNAFSKQCYRNRGRL
ncbi:hypothetical protein F5Y19DRAFT_443709 [Xylariaceae sp. FL1651]|nr:hypothetical protein F5Y19DRAFT_443709 [Xylariaceae sp. FL1651]